MNDEMYTYVFIRTDLSIAQQIVQASHASAMAGHKFGDHCNMVLFAIPDES